MSVSISLQHLTKTFIKNNALFTAVSNVNIEVKRGELLTFLGPSGCGKTTTLRMVAGFEEPTSGTILFDNKDVTKVMVNQRDIGFVFQNYALFLHMTVFDNVAYGLRARKVSETEIKQKVSSYLKLVGLPDVEKNFPNQLSGGEQQRVALARVLVLEPQVLLMDEPLSNLDAKLRIHMRTEIRRIQKQLNLTALYVTHDQKEALTMSDRIMVMNKGKIEQIGTPFGIYADPASLFVADFIGQANIIQGVLQEHNGQTCTVLVGNKLIHARPAKNSKKKKKKDVAVVVRPECLQLASNLDESQLSGKINLRTFLGDRIDYYITLETEDTVHVEQPFSSDTPLVEEGSVVGITFKATNAVVLNRP